MQQIICIHGGYVRKNTKQYLNYLQTTTYDPREPKQDRKKRLQEKLKDTHQMIIPEFPCKQHAKYKERSIRWEKILAHHNTNNNLILIGHSLGAIFLIKRLSENKPTRNIAALHLISPALSHKKEPLYSFSAKRKNIPTLIQHVHTIHIYHSLDDNICSYKDSQEIHKLLPGSHVHIFTDRGHFRQSEFVELYQIITST